jgi:hypothetical protein
VSIQQLLGLGLVVLTYLVVQSFRLQVVFGAIASLMLTSAILQMSMISRKEWEGLCGRVSFRLPFMSHDYNLTRSEGVKTKSD